MSGRLFLVFLTVLLLSGRVLAVGEGVGPVDECMRANLPKRASKQTVDLVSTDRTAGSRTLNAEIHWRQGEDGHSQTHVDILAPPADRGSSYLSLEGKDRSDTWVCLPELKKVRRVVPGSEGSGSLFGTDFSYEDFQHMQRISKDSASKRMPDTTLGGREVYIVYADTTSQEGSDYHHIVYSIDQKTCIPLRIEFFETESDLRKLLESDPESITQEGEGWVARSVTIQDRVTETHSKLEVQKIELDVEIPSRMFSLGYLERHCR